MSLHLRIFLSSPGDVVEERQRARDLIARLNKDHLLKGRARLEAVSWDDPDAPPSMPVNLTPQEAVNRGLAKPSNCDIVVVLFWDRMGTELDRSEGLRANGEPYRSGTEWEFADALNAPTQPARPVILLYRRTGFTPYASDPNDPKLTEQLDQRRKVEAFFDELRRKKRFATEVASPEDFERRLENDLKHQISLLPEFQPAKLPTAGLAGWFNAELDRYTAGSSFASWLFPSGLFLLCAITLMPSLLERDQPFIFYVLLLTVTSIGFLITVSGLVALTVTLIAFAKRLVVADSKLLQVSSDARRRRALWLRGGVTFDWLLFYQGTIQDGLNWFSTRFGLPHAWWKGIDFCLFWSFLYSPVVFFLGLFAFGGDENVGDLRISVFELAAEEHTTEEGPESLLIIPVIFFAVAIFLIHYVAQKTLLRAYGYSARNSLAGMLLVSVLIALSLGVLGFGAGFVALSVAIGAWHVRKIVGAGFVCVCSALIATFVLGVMAYGADKGVATLSVIADSLHQLQTSDIHRFILLWILFPFINAVYDFTSWWVSLCLGRSLLEWHLKPGRGTSLSPRHYASSLFLMIVDAVVAVLLLVFLAWTTGFSLAVCDRLGEEESCYVDLNGNLASLSGQPLGGGFGLLRCCLVP